MSFSPTAILPDNLSVLSLFLAVTNLWSSELILYASSYNTLNSVSNTLFCSKASSISYLAPLSLSSASFLRFKSNSFDSLALVTSFSELLLFS